MAKSAESKKGRKSNWGGGEKGKKNGVEERGRGKERRNGNEERGRGMGGSKRGDKKRRK